MRPDGPPGTTPLIPTLFSQGTPMALAPAKSPRPSKARAIVRRTRGQTHGPVTRLMSPFDFGEILKPFVFLDLFDHEGAPLNGPLHPHSGIATPDLRRARRRQVYRPGQRRGHTGGRRRRVDAGWTRHVARRRARQSRPDARLPALDRFPAGTRIRSDHQTL